MTAYMAWKGIQGDENIWWTYFDGQAWATQSLVKQTGGTSNGPGLSQFNETLLLVWKGPGSEQSLNWNTRGATDWAGRNIISGVGTSNGAALLGDGMCWKGAGDDQNIYWSLFDGQNWAAQQGVAGSGGTSGVPALAKFRGTPYMVWKGPGTNSGISWATFDGNNWNPSGQEVPGTGPTSAGPALAATSTGLLMTWKGPAGTNDEQSMFWTTFDGTSWNPSRQQVPDMGTSTGPALVAIQGGILMAWKGASAPRGDDQSIWWSIFDGRNWKTQDTVPGVGTSDRPALAQIGEFPG